MLNLTSPRETALESSVLIECSRGGRMRTSSPLHFDESARAAHCATRLTVRGARCFLLAPRFVPIDALARSLFAMRA